MAHWMVPSSFNWFSSWASTSAGKKSDAWNISRGWKGGGEEGAKAWEPSSVNYRYTPDLDILTWSLPCLLNRESGFFNTVDTWNDNFAIEMIRLSYLLECASTSVNSGLSLLQLQFQLVHVLPHLPHQLFQSVKPWKWGLHLLPLDLSQSQALWAANLGRKTDYK